MKAAIVLASALLISLPAAAQTRSGPATESDRATEQGGKDNKARASNAGLTGKVKSALAADVGLKTVTNIDVDSDNGVVTLKGHVDSANSKQLAEKVAKRVSGVKSVKNELRVEGKS